MPQVVIVIAQLTVTEFVAGLPEESTTLAVNEKAPGDVGVPVMAPVDAFNVSPGGNAPEEIKKV